MRRIEAVGALPAGIPPAVARVELAVCLKYLRGEPVEVITLTAKEASLLAEELIRAARIVRVRTGAE